MEISPITIVKDDDVRGRQVDTKTSGAGSKQKDKLLAARLIIFVDCDDPVVVSRAAIDATIF